MVLINNMKLFTNANIQKNADMPCKFSIHNVSSIITDWVFRAHCAQFQLYCHAAASPNLSFSPAPYPIFIPYLSYIYPILNRINKV